MLNSTRQLAAIMFTDIVGYTAMMGKDSKKALELVRVSKTIQKPLVEKHNGKWLKEMGDGAMAQFGSALDAVNCALEIQRLSRADFEADFRIGIHLGDITIENDDVYGDGVNVAARLESIADPGGIYISESIEKAIRGQSNVQAKYIGEVNLRNVDYGVRTYALQGVGLPVPQLKNDKELSGRFFAEVKRRGVIRAGIVYVLVSLLLVLLQPFVASWISLPASFKTGLLVVLGIGFPIAVLLAWRYERSPEGFVSSSSDKSWQNPLNASQRKPFTGNMVTWGLAIIIIGLLIYSNLNKKNTAADQDIRLAILPFRNNSGNDELNHFGMGMASEVRSKLSYSKKFDLISSMQATIAYANTTASPIEIGQDLKVDYLLTGMYQVAGEQIKVDIEMVDAQSGNGIWNRSFNELFTDIFEVQSKIASNVMSGFSFDQKLEDEAPTMNLDAYGQYLLGMEKRQIEGVRSLSPIDNFISAIQLDSGYSDAWVRLIDLECHQLFAENLALDLDSLLIEVGDQLAEVNRRFPDSWKKTLMFGYYAYYGIRDYDQGEELCKEILNNDSENEDANHMLASIYKRKMFLEKGIQHELKVLRQNPRCATCWGNTAQIFMLMGDYKSATKAAQKMVELRSIEGKRLLSRLNYAQGKISPQEIIDNVEQNLRNKYIERDFYGLIVITEEMELPAHVAYYYKAKSHFLLDKLDSARYNAQKAIEHLQNSTSGLRIEKIYAILGNREKAMELIKDEIDENLHIGDYNRACNNYRLEIDLLCILGDYELATEKLLELNRNFPQYGDYARFYHLPEYDKIKQEYPPFLEALNNLKLPMKLNLDAIELL